MLIVVLCAPVSDEVAAADATAASHSRTLYLVRHGEYLYDPKADDAAGPPLTALGIAQARLLAARLAGLPGHFDSVTSSTMLRARQTADVINQTLHAGTIERSASLSECTPHANRPLEGASEQDLTACDKRLDAVFARRFRPASSADRNELIVAHGNVIRYLVTRAMGVDPRQWLSMSVANASLTIIRVRSDGGFSIVTVGDIGHIPPNLQSWNTADDPQLVAP
jgi:serine/threonine-protein phosphatase PGAM5